MYGNSKKKGGLTFFIYFKDKEWVGVCLEMDIVKVGTNREEVEKDLLSSTFSIIQLVMDGKLSEKVLNKPAPNEYMKMYLDAFDKKNVPRSDVIAYRKPIKNILSNDLCLA